MSHTMHTHAQWKCSEYFNVCASVLVCELQGAKLRVQQLSIPMWPLLTLHRSAGVPLHRVNYLWVFSTVIMGGCPLSNHPKHLIEKCGDMPMWLAQRTTSCALKNLKPEVWQLTLVRFA